MSVREPLDPAPLRASLVGPGRIWTALEVADSVGSSNSVLAERARQGAAPAGSVLVAEEQTSGRGRRDRTWVAPQYSSVMVSVLVAPEVDQARWGWLPLVTALAVTDAVASTASVEAGIKWPNDVVVDEAKLAGILSEVVATPSGPRVVVGAGINVDQSPQELPATGATSIRCCGRSVDRGELLVAYLTAWERWYCVWLADVAGGTSELADAYRSRSRTLGQAVRVHLPDGSLLSGAATGLDEHGHLLVEVDGTQQVVASADVVHLRPDRSDGLPR